MPARERPHPRRWLLWRVWHAVTWGELEIGPAVRALVRSLPAAEIRATWEDPRRGAHLQRVGRNRGPEHHTRDQALREALEAAGRSEEAPPDAAWTLDTLSRDDAPGADVRSSRATSADLDHHRVIRVVRTFLTGATKRSGAASCRTRYAGMVDLEIH